MKSRHINPAKFQLKTLELLKVLEFEKILFIIKVLENLKRCLKLLNIN